MGNHQIRSDILQFLKRDKQEIVWSTIVGSPLSSDALIAELQPDIGVSILYPHIISASTIALFPGSIINLHPALLPYCRGKYPALWAIIEHNPAGATVHYVDEGVDTGDIIAQEYVKYYDDSVCSYIYERCVRTGYWVFLRAWDLIKEGNPRRVPQPRHKATFHLKSEVQEPDKWFSMTVKEIRKQWKKGDY